MATLSRPHLPGATATRLLFVGGVVLGFWLLTLLFGSSSARADSPDVQTTGSAQSATTHVTGDLAGTLHDTAQRTVMPVTVRIAELTRLSQQTERHLASRVDRAATTVRRARAVITAAVERPMRVVVEVVATPIRLVGGITDTSVSAIPAAGERAAVGRTTSIGPVAGRSTADPATVAPTIGTSSRPDVHEVALNVPAAVDTPDRSERTPQPPASPPVSPPVGNGNTPGVNRGNTHDAPAAPAPTPSAAHRERAWIALSAPTPPVDGTPPPRPGFSPD